MVYAYCLFLLVIVATASCLHHSGVFCLLRVSVFRCCGCRCYCWLFPVGCCLLLLLTLAGCCCHCGGARAAHMAQRTIPSTCSHLSPKQYGNEQPLIITWTSKAASTNWPHTGSSSNPYQTRKQNWLGDVTVRVKWCGEKGRERVCDEMRFSQH